MRHRPNSLSHIVRGCLLLGGVSGTLSAREVKELADLDLEQLARIPIVSAARHEQSRLGSPRAVSVITAEEIRRRNFRNVPEAVGSLAGVYLQQTNYAGGSPILRGMIGNRILLMLNGVRLNNGTYRLGPNQYLNYIDIDQVDRIEVVRGAGSVLYGSDAFGGVINVITKSAPDPRQSTPPSTHTRVRFASADSSGTGRLEVSGSKGPLGVLGGFSQEQFGDLNAGRGTGLQRYTGYGQAAGDVALTYALGPDRSLAAGVSRLRQAGVPRTDLLQAGSDLRHLWSAEGLDLAFLQYTASDVAKHIGALQMTVAFQRPFEDLDRILASDPSAERFYKDATRTASLGLQLTSAAGQSHVLTYGLDAASDWTHSVRTDVHLPTGAKTSRPGSYPDGTRFQSLGLFLQDEVRISDRLDGVLGLRYDRFGLKAEVNDPLTGSLAVDAQSAALNGSAHVLCRLTPHFSATAGVSQGFRAPNVNDAAILGGVGAIFEIPNAHLRPERSVNLEAGLRAAGRLGNASLVVFDDRYRDLIDRAPALLGGLPFVDSNGNGIKDGKELNVTQRQNTSRARVRGVEFETMLNLSENWTWSHSTTWTTGTDTGLAQPLPRIPPLNGVSRITWQTHGPLWVEAALVAASGQRRLAPADKSDVRIGPNGTAGYSVLHLRAGLRRSPLAGLSIAWENLTNRRYRLHGSGFDRPGSNLIVGFSRSF